jgi:hypothetical protein
MQPCLELGLGLEQAGSRPTPITHLRIENLQFGIQAFLNLSPAAWVS